MRQIKSKCLYVFTEKASHLNITFKYTTKFSKYIQQIVPKLTTSFFTKNSHYYELGSKELGDIIPTSGDSTEH